MDTDTDQRNLHYIEGLGTVRLPGEYIPEFHEVPEGELAATIPQTRPDSAIPKHQRHPGITLPSFVFANTNGDAGLAAPIPYGRANTVRVDNYSTQWCRVGGVYIPPQTIGWVIALDRAVTEARLAWSAPIGATQTPLTTNAQVYTFWYEERFPPQTGIPVAPAMSPAATLNTSQVAVTTGTSIIAGNGERRTVTIFNTAASGGNIVYIGATSGVSTTTGGAIPPQFAFTLSNYSGAIYGSATGGSSTTVTVTEESA